MIDTIESAYGSVSEASICSIAARRSSCSWRRWRTSPTRPLPAPSSASSSAPRDSAATSTGSFEGSARYSPVAIASRMPSMRCWALSTVAAVFRSGRSLAVEFTPTSVPSSANTGPPESPGLSGASIASTQPSRPITRPTRSGGGRHGFRSGPSGCPNATTVSPVASFAAAPSSTNGNSLPPVSIFTNPTSPSGPKCCPAVVPRISVPSASSTFMRLPGCCPTWPAVSTQPSFEMIVPLPEPFSVPCSSSVTSPTTAGRTFAATARMRDSSACSACGESISSPANARAATHATASAATAAIARHGSQEGIRIMWSPRRQPALEGSLS